MLLACFRVAHVQLVENKKTEGMTSTKHRGNIIRFKQAQGRQLSSYGSIPIKETG